MLRASTGSLQCKLVYVSTISRQGIRVRTHDVNLTKFIKFTEEKNSLRVILTLAKITHSVLHSLHACVCVKYEKNIGPRLYIISIQLFVMGRSDILGQTQAVLVAHAYHKHYTCYSWQLMIILMYYLNIQTNKTRLKEFIYVKKMFQKWQIQQGERRLVLKLRYCFFILSDPALCFLTWVFNNNSYTAGCQLSSGQWQASCSCV